VDVVLLDTNQLIRGLIGRGDPRRVLGLLAWGRLQLRRRELHLDEAAAGRVAGKLNPPLDEQAERLRGAIDRAEGEIGMVIPGHYVLAVSQPLLDEFSRVLRDRDLGIGRLDPHEISAARHLILATASVVAPDFNPADVPQRVDADRDDDMVVHSALLAQATWLVTDDKHICPRGRRVTYVDEGSGHRVTALRSDDFAAEVETSNFSLGMIDVGLLRRVVAALSAAPTRR